MQTRLETTIKELDTNNKNLEDLLAIEKDKHRALQAGVNAMQLNKNALAIEHASLEHKVNDLERSLGISRENLDIKEAFLTEYKKRECVEWQARRAAEKETNLLRREAFHTELNRRSEVFQTELNRRSEVFQTELNIRKEVRPSLPTFNVRTLN